MSRRKKPPESKQLQSDARLLPDVLSVPDSVVRIEVDDLTLAMRQLMQVPGDVSTKL